MSNWTHNHIKYKHSSVAWIQGFNMVDLNFLKIISVIKKLFEAVLFVAFLYMTVKALIDVFSNRTILVVSKEHRNITYLPAFSVCDNIFHASRGFDKKDLANGSMVMQSFAVKFNFEVTLIIDGGNGLSSGTNFNLMDDMKIQNNLHNVTLADLWTLQCKPFFYWASHCMPCITFNGAHLKKHSIELAVVNLYSFIVNLSRSIMYVAFFNQRLKLLWMLTIVPEAKGKKELFSYMKKNNHYYY